MALIPHGTVHVNDSQINNLYPVGSQAGYFCEIHFYLVGPRKITCQASGSWVPEPGRCIHNSKFHY